MKSIPLSDLSDEDLIEICRVAEVIACECPGYLAQLLRQVRSFRQYTNHCIEQFPADAETHRWLVAQAKAVEAILLETLTELMQKENLLDQSGHVSLEKLSERSHSLQISPD